MNGNRIVKIDSIDQLTRWWPFFETGHEFLSSKTGADVPISLNEFRTLLIGCVCKSFGDESWQYILVLTSKNNKPLGFTVMTARMTPLGSRVARINFVYSNKRCPSAEHELFFEAQKFAKIEGFRTIETISYRPYNISTLTWFKKRFNYDAKYTTFQKLL